MQTRVKYLRVVVGWNGSYRNTFDASTVSRFVTEALTHASNLKGLAQRNPCG